ncbi:MAG: hypothetical protein IT370_15095 [Deltaproteobacteria bacterium]|nr:hypothetical protein [Deltaproteobacteria bacterium]
MTPRRNIRRSALAVGLLALLVLGQTVAAAAVYRCRMDGAARAHCCCPRPAAKQAPSGPSITRQGCCKVQFTEARVASVVAEAARTAQDLRLTVVAPAIVVDVPAPVVAVAVATVPRPLEEVRPPHAPPLLLLKSSLLI